jgi:hypothetical protein
VTRSGAAPMTFFNASLSIAYASRIVLPTKAGVAGGSSAPGGPVLNVRGIGAGTAVTLIGEKGHATVNVGNAAGCGPVCRGPGSPGDRRFPVRSRRGWQYITRTTMGRPRPRLGQVDASEPGPGGRGHHPPGSFPD